MITFEISLNGRRVYTCGVGEIGCLNFAVSCVTTQVGSPSIAGVGSAVATDRSAMMWPHIELKVGDEIGVRVIEADERDAPEQSYSLPLDDSVKPDDPSSQET